jgi:hypothetical protein
MEVKIEVKKVYQRFFLDTRAFLNLPVKALVKAVEADLGI